jgi:hypothetical protein
MVKNDNNADMLKTKWENLLYKVDLFTRKLGIFKFFAHYLSCYNKIYTNIVTPYVFGFHNCIAFHKHEHQSSRSCLYFACNMSMQHTLMCLFHNLLAYEMWVVQLVDTTWDLILRNMTMLLVYHDRLNWCNKVLKHVQHDNATFWWKYCFACFNLCGTSNFG